MKSNKPPFTQTKRKLEKKRYPLLNKTVVTAKRNESVKKFFSRVAQTAVSRYQCHSKTKVVIRGDDDPWILRLKYEHFPHATFYLGPYHVFKKLETAFGSSVAAQSLKHYVYKHNPRGLLGEIENLIEQLAEEKDKKKLQDFYNYIENNIEGLMPDTEETIPYKRRWPALFKRGSGAIERNIALCINDRCKQPRMSWSNKGLGNILYLRENYLNKHFPKTPSKRFATVIGAIK